MIDRAAGFDVIAVAETSPGASDHTVVAAANNEDRIPITEGRDLGELVIRRRLGTRGLVLLELDRLSNEAEATLVSTIISTHLNKLPGNLFVIEPARVRLRPLTA